jgi:hypothetical protein
MKSGVYLIDPPVVPTPAVNRVSHLSQVARRSGGGTFREELRDVELRVDFMSSTGRGQAATAWETG